MFWLSASSVAWLAARATNRPSNENTNFKSVVTFLQESLLLCFSVCKTSKSVFFILSPKLSADKTP